jgi:tubulin monoglycylase TTLL3/8
MERPMLVSGRKFDIRCFVLITNDIKKGLKAYFFKDAYVRTSSKKYSLANISDREAHLTNDAVQKNSKNYCKYEEGNKLSFTEWQENIAINYPNAPNDIVENQFRPEIMRLSAITIAAASEQLRQTNINKSFELLGYDYMVDDEFNVTLIEINSNPCLEFVCPLLTEIISSLIENVVRVALDISFPPPFQGSRTLACDEAISNIKQDDIKFTQIYP